MSDHNERGGPTHAVILYDPKTGVIRYTLLETTPGSSSPPDWPAMEAKLSELVKAHNQPSSGLATLHSENHDPENFYKVDTQRRVLVKATPGA